MGIDHDVISDTDTTYYKVVVRVLVVDSFEGSWLGLGLGLGLGFPV